MFLEVIFIGYRIYLFVRVKKKEGLFWESSIVFCKVSKEELVYGFYDFFLSVFIFWT